MQNKREHKLYRLLDRLLDIDYNIIILDKTYGHHIDERKTIITSIYKAIEEENKKVELKLTEE